MGFWGKVGKAALIAGAGTATAFTGGAASPLLAAAIAAGTGAAVTKATGGSWKDALITGGIGAATGGLGGGLGGAASGGLKAAGSSAIKQAAIKAGTSAAQTKLGGGSFKDAALSGGIAAGVGALGGKLGGGGGSARATGVPGSVLDAVGGKMDPTIGMPGTTGAGSVPGGWQGTAKDALVTAGKGFLTKEGMQGASTIAGNIAKQKAAGREIEATLNIRNDQNRLQAHDSAQDAEFQNANAVTNQQQLALQQKEFTEKALTGRYNQAMQGAAAMNMQDVKASRPKGIPNISFSGGLRPTAFGAEGKAAGAELNRQAMLRMMQGDKFDPMTAPKMLGQFQTAALPQETAVDKMLAAISMGGAFGGMLPDGTPAPAPGMALPGVPPVPGAAAPVDPTVAAQLIKQGVGASAGVSPTTYGKKVKF